VRIGISDGTRPGPIGRLIPTALLLLAVIGCADSNDRVLYRLANVGSDTLPVILQREPGCLHVLTAGEVVFSGRQHYESSFTIERRCAAEALSIVPDPGTSGTVEIARDTAYFLNADGQRTGFGILTADTLVVRGDVHLLRYYRARMSNR
jgi:hypothetical protein